MREKIIANVLGHKIIAIVRGADPDSVVRIGQALADGGINMIEVTFDQKSTDNYAATLNSIRALNTAFGGKVLVGAGTVLSVEQLKLAKEAGAGYMITPSVDTEVIRYCRKLDMAALPGALTPSEAVAAWNAGADFVKIFPAGGLGPSYIKSIKAPLSHIPLIAVGGVSEKNIGDFLRAGCVGAGCGGPLVRKDLIAEGRFDELTELAEKFVKAAEEA